MNERFQLSAHAFDMMQEREIPEDWILTVLNEPESVEAGDEGNIHYFGSISEFSGRVLHIVVNPDLNPQRIVTLFFDRRRRRSQ